MSIARTWAEYCAALRYDDLPDAVVDQVKKLALDIVGNAAGGYAWMESGKVVTEAVARLDPGVGGDATVVATGGAASPAYAGLVNGTMAHSLDYDNHHAKGVIHAGSSVVCAALAAGEAVAADGRTVLTAIVAGYEVACRLAMACNPFSAHEIGFHPTGTCGVFGATAAIGTVLGLDADQLEHAFGINGSQAAGSMQYDLNSAWNKRAHPGFAVHSAYIAATLAQSGFIGAADVIEGDDGFLQGYCSRPRPEAATAGLGEAYETLEVAIKPYPLCRYTHMLLEQVLDIVRSEDLDPTEVTGCDVVIPKYGVNLVGRPEEAKRNPESAVAAQFSAPFAAALAVTRRDAGLATFRRVLDEGFSPDFVRIMHATTVNDSEEVNALHPEKWPARITLKTTRGAFERFETELRGEPGVPMPWADLEAKFAELSSQFGEDTRAGVVAAVRDLEQAGARGVTAPIRAAAGAAGAGQVG